MAYKQGEALEEALILIKSEEFKAQKQNAENSLVDKMNFSGNVEVCAYISILLKKVFKFEETITTFILDVRKINSGVFGNKKKLKEYLNTYFNKTEEFSEYKIETRELLKYFYKWDTAVKENDVDPLIDVNDKIDSELNILFELINIKISEVSSARVSLTNLIISIVAIIIALISNP